MSNGQIEEGLGFAEFKCPSLNNMRTYSVERSARGLNEVAARNRAARLANREVRRVLEELKEFTKCAGECQTLFFGPYIEFKVSYSGFVFVKATVKSTGTLIIDCVP